MHLILITGVDSGYCPVPCGIPQGSQISSVRECGNSGLQNFWNPENIEMSRERREESG